MPSSGDRTLVGADRLLHERPNLGNELLDRPPRFNDRYYASFIEDDNGIRLEFMYSPPREAAAD